MKRISNKIKLISILFLGVVLAISTYGFIKISTNKNVSAATEPIFAMEYGAYIRTDEPIGLRFVAKVDATLGLEVIENTNKSFGALIVPNDYLETYGVSDDFLTEFIAKGVTINYKEGLNLSNVPDTDGLYRIAYSITNVKDINMARDFFAIFYIKDATDAQNPTYQYATFNEGENVRNISSIAKLAIQAYANNGALTETLQSYITKGNAGALVNTINNLKRVDETTGFTGGEYSYILGAKDYYDSLDDEQKALVTNYSQLEALKQSFESQFEIEMLLDMTEAPVPGNYGETTAVESYIVDSVYGKMYNAKKGLDNLSFKVTSEKDLTGYKVYAPIILNLTSASSKNVNVQFLTELGAWSSGKVFYLPMTTKTVLEFDGSLVSDSTGVSQILVRTVEVKASGEMAFAPIYAAKQKFDVRITKLASRVDVNNLKASDYTYIYPVKTAYDALDATEQSKIANVATLNNIYNAYMAKYDVVVLADMTEGNISQGKWSTWGSAGLKVNYETDTVYGNVAKFTATGSHFSMLIASERTDLTDYTLYVPVSLSLNSLKTGKVRWDTAQSGYGTGVEVTGDGAWTVCEYSCSGISTTSQIFIRSEEGCTNAGSGTYTFATVYAAKLK